MKFSKDVERKIIAALLDRLPGQTLGQCPLCHVTDWELVDAFVAITITPEPLEVYLGGQILPNAVLICQNCGNTHFLNLNTLGLKELLVIELDKLGRPSVSPARSVIDAEASLSEE